MSPDSQKRQIVWQITLSRQTSDRLVVTKLASNVRNNDEAEQDPVSIQNEWRILYLKGWY